MLDAGHGRGRGDLLLGILQRAQHLRILRGLGVEPEVEGLAHIELRGGLGVEDVLKPLTGLGQAAGRQCGSGVQFEGLQQSGSDIAAGVAGVHAGLHRHQDLAVGALESLGEFGQQGDEPDAAPAVLGVQPHDHGGGGEDLHHGDQVLLARESFEGAGHERDLLLLWGLGRGIGATFLTILLRHAGQTTGRGDDNGAPASTSPSRTRTVHHRAVPGLTPTAASSASMRAPLLYQASAHVQRAMGKPRRHSARSRLRSARTVSSTACPETSR